MRARLYVRSGSGYPSRGSAVDEAGEVVAKVLLDYPHQIAGHCGSGALRDLMEWAGLCGGETPSEALAFGLGGDLGLTYVRGTQLPAPVYLVGRGSDLELAGLGRLGAGARLVCTEDPIEGWDWVKAELDAGRPASGPISESCRTFV